MSNNSNRRLLIMRHAKSDWGDENLADFDRPLNARGIRNASAMATYVATLDFNPSLIVCSTALRARQTAEIVGEALQPIDFSWRDQLYLADLNTLLAQTNEVSAQAWILVGHNPGLEDLVSYLVPRLGEQVDHQKLMPTASCYLIDMPGDGTAIEGRAKLLAHQRPKSL